MATGTDDGDLAFRVTEDASQAISENEALSASQDKIVASSAAQSEATEGLTADQISLIATTLQTTEEDIASLSVGAQKLALSQARAQAVKVEVDSIRGSALAEEIQSAAQEQAAISAAALAEAQAGLTAEQVALIVATLQTTEADVASLSVGAQKLALSQARSQSAAVEVAAIRGSALGEEALAGSMASAAVAAEAEGVAEVGNAAAKGLATGASRELNNAENVLTLSRGRMIRAAIDEAAGTLGIKDALAGLAPVIVGVAIGAVALETGLNALKSRGVETTTIMDFFGQVMDKVAISMGGTSAATQKVAVDILKYEDKLKETGQTQDAFATGSGRLAASNASVGDSMNRLQPGMLTMIQQFLGMGDGSDKAAVEIEKLNGRLNILAAFDPKGARDLNDQLIAMVNQGTPAATAIDKITAEANKQINSFSQLTAELAKVGPRAQDAFAEAATSMGPLIAERQKLLALGYPEAQVDAVLSAAYQKLAGDIRLVGPALADTSVDFQQQAAQIIALAGKIDDPYLAKLEKLKEAQDKQKADFGQVNDAINASALKYGQLGQAVITLSPEILKMSDALHKEQDAGVALDATQTKELAILDAWIAKYKLRGAALDADSAKEDAHAKKIYDTVNALDSESKKYEETTAKITATLQEQTRSIDATKNATLTSIQAQIDALTREGINDQAHADKLNQLLGEESAAEQKALQEKIAALDTAASKQKEADAAATQSKTTLLSNLKEETGGEEDWLAKAKQVHDGYKAAVGGDVTAMNAVQKALGQTVGQMVAAGTTIETTVTPKIKSHGVAYDEAGHKIDTFGEKVKSVVEPLGALGTAMDGAKGHVDAFGDAHGNATPKINATADAVGRLLSVTPVGDSTGPNRLSGGPGSGSGAPAGGDQ